MAGYVLNLTGDENITLSGDVVRRLIDSGSGDAALAYLCLLRGKGTVSAQMLCEQLHWESARVRAAESVLSALKLISLPPEEEKSEKPPIREKPSYSRDDIARKLEGDKRFTALLQEVERKLGPLSAPSVGKLLGLYEDVGLPADVIFLLVSYCIERWETQYGVGRKPTMSFVEREGYVWARKELFSTAAANEFLKLERERRSAFGGYLSVLGITDRAPSASEEKYLNAWIAMGFPPESVAVAYDKTVLNCHSFKWPYCNGILRKWHEKGLHTLHEVSEENNAPKEQSSGKNDWMKEYL